MKLPIPSLVSLCALLSMAHGQVVITEFMASNTRTLTDENGSFQDWIELENTSTSAVNLFNWSLTDSAGNLNKWKFPAKTLAPRERLVVFASSKDRVNPTNNLHTNFSLSAGGEYLALVRPDGSIATEFSPNFPIQIQDLSYGFPVQTTTTTHLASGASLKYFVPTNGSLETNWTQPMFNDAAWASGTNGIGYDTGSSDSSEELNYSDTMLDAAPLGYWRFNEATGTTAANLGTLGAAANGAYAASTILDQNGPLPPTFNGFEAGNKSIGLTGTTQQVVIPDDPAFDLGTGAYAIEMWFNPSNITARGDLFTYKGAGGDFGIHLASQTAGKISVYHNGFIGAASGNLVVNTWYHLVVTRTASGTLYVYLNGVQVNSGTSTGNMNISSSLLIGSNHTGTPTNPSAVFRGQIDEAAIFNREVTAAEAFSRYTRAVGSLTYPEAVAASAPLGYWRANESTGTTANNTGTLGAAANGTYTNGATLNQEGPRPTTYKGFEANNTAVGITGGQQLIVPDATAFDMGTGPFAVEMWFYPTNASVRGDLFTYKGAGGDFGIHLASQVANTISVYHGGFIGTAAGPIVNNQWHHLIVTRNSSSTLTAYLNGVAILSGTDTGSMNIANSPVFGSNHNGTPTTPTIPFSGRMDEMAIYNREITAAEALNRYQRSQEAAPNFSSHFATNVQSALFGINSGIYTRIPFNVTNKDAISRLALRMKYDDGFVAYVNGHPVLGVNSPEPVEWNSTATVRHADSLAAQFQDFEFNDAIQWLQEGTNTLAIHALNISASNYDLLNTVELISTSITNLGTTPSYLSVATPGEINVTGTVTPGPVITLPTHTPAQPAEDEDLIITVKVQPTFSAVTAVNLNYRVMYGSVTQIPMFDDGAHGDGAAGDQVYGATIPATASTAGQMIRWYFTASDTTSPGSRWPLFTDPLASAEYLGTVVKSITSNLPVWEWFAENVANARSTTGTRGSVYFNGQFLDNVFVRSRGAATSTGSQKFDFNPGDKCLINDEVGRVGEANINAPGSDGSYIRPPLAFETYRLAGHPACVAFNTVLRVNGGADRVGYYAEQVDDDFLERNDLDPEGALYKFVQRGSGTPVFTDATDAVEKKTRKTESSADLQAFVAGLALADVDARRAWFWDNVNVPNLLNYLALSRITQDADDVRKNFYMYRDTNGNGEWSIFPWDKDWTFGVVGDGMPHLTHPFFGDAAHGKQPTGANPQWNKLWDFVFNDATISPLAMRRLRTLMDQMLQPPGTTNGLFEQRATAWMTLLSPNVPTTVSNQLAGVLNFFPTRRNDLFNTYSITNGAPGSQLIPDALPASQPITIVGVDFNPASGNQEQEYIQLTNNGTFDADISGWKLDGAVTMTLDPGTVVPAGASIYASPNSAAFRTRSAGPTGGQRLQVQDRYNGQLSARGETVELKDPSGQLITTFAYTPAPTPAQLQLRITEIQYDPAGPNGTEAGLLPGVSGSDFEFIELQNIGLTPLELLGCHFDKGITFTFTTATTLAPGGRIVLVSNAVAFALRYPTVAIGGAFTGNLSNSGETLQLLDAAGEVVLEFSYSPDWYGPTNGGGRSLVVRDASPNHTTYDEPTHWAISGTDGGTPGANDPDFAYTYEGWRWDHFSDNELYLPSPPNPAGIFDAAFVGPAADADNDTTSNLGEYAFGLNPRVANGEAFVATDRLNVGPDTYATFTFHRRAKALDLHYIVEFSSDLNDWTPATTEVGTPTALGNGMEVTTYLDPTPNVTPRRFARARVQKF